ncbi:dTDP-4-dehydrorhamnose 3,5-epimerase [Candidatus Liberibacter sp.]|uniref:dTDP-4-dehydrorhamnose 3,5-epimerase n=1 Tax=Candidatus Liberibacter sp. TaxID=34022 RepID=UPI0015F75BDB|nr:dTDP-4-dehydrorhamnose 3,5-epimerase [Candidatus Liberibacter sp.]MBA5723735.1 dTDP-4-dehydrorhamnose 3,5-epimerase [Candidatus Liberibacter sp.]
MVIVNPVRVLKAKKIKDNRGWFSESYNDRALRDIGIDDVFVQENHSFSSSIGTVRGLHFQKPPRSQAKLVRCIVGRVFDVVVDIRKNSPTWSHWVGLELSARNHLQIYVPVGFAHGFMTLEPNTEVIYKVTNFYSKEYESGIFWKDVSIGIEWPRLENIFPNLSEKDMLLSRLQELDSPFDYNGMPLFPLDLNQYITCV